MRRFARTALVALALSGCAYESPPKLATVSDFDVDRYLGQWHQVAAIPAWFQADGELLGQLSELHIRYAPDALAVLAPH